MCGAIVQAGQWDRSTKITVNEAIEVPGAVLPAGTYNFRVVDTAYPHIVQVLNENGDHVLATVIAIPEYRSEPANKTVLEFNEGTPGKPLPVRAWFYPGDTYGNEFVYTK